MSESPSNVEVVVESEHTSTLPTEMTLQEQTDTGRPMSEPQSSLPLSSNDQSKAEQQPQRRKSSWYQFDGFKIAEGYHLAGIARGALVMSNIFLSTAIIYLAQEEAGCVDDEGETIDDCEGEVYGFKPASFVSNIAVISGVLSAVFMPFIGAMVDCTDHRKTVGIVACALMILIQTAQIGTVAKTWFIMTCLQAIAGFLYQVLVLSVYAYLPDMSYIIGEKTLNHYSSIFVMSQFASQCLFLVTVIGLSLAFGISDDDVSTAQMSQAIDVVWSGVFFFLAWRAFPAVPARRVLDDGRSLFVEGFSKVFRTAQRINRDYKKGTRWYFLCLILAEAATNAFTVVSVVFLGEHLDMSGFEIGIFFFITLVGALPGSILGRKVTAATDPKRSWRICMLVMTVWTISGAFALDVLPVIAAYPWGFGIGITLGWFYPVENVFFAMCLPKGQESELAGFFVYCTQIIGWLPPLLFSFMVEADVSQTYGVVVVALFYPIAIAIISMAAPWPEILEEAGRMSMTTNALDEEEVEEEEVPSDEKEQEGGRQEQAKQPENSSSKGSVSEEVIQA